MSDDFSSDSLYPSGLSDAFGGANQSPWSSFPGGGYASAPDPLANLSLPATSSPWQMPEQQQPPTVGSQEWLAAQSSPSSQTYGGGSPGYPGSGTSSTFSSPAQNPMLGQYNQMGQSLISQLQGYKPQLPAAAQSEMQAALASLGLAQPAMASAQGIINSGGTTAPNYAQQLASIQGNYQQNLQQGNANLMQNQANTGQTGMVQGQQLNALGQRLNTQEQNEISQAQQFDVATAQQSYAQAVQQMTGANQALGQISQMQWQQDQAQQQAMMQAQQIMAQLMQANANTVPTPGTVGAPSPATPAVGGAMSEQLPPGTYMSGGMLRM